MDRKVNMNLFTIKKMN